MGAMAYFLWLQLPVPLFFTAMLSIPMPSILQRLVLAALDRLYVPVSALPGRMSIIGVSTWAALLVFIIESVIIGPNYHYTGPIIGPNHSPELIESVITSRRSRSRYTTGSNRPPPSRSS